MFTPLFTLMYRTFFRHLRVVSADFSRTARHRVEVVIRLLVVPGLDGRCQPQSGGRFPGEEVLSESQRAERRRVDGLTVLVRAAVRTSSALWRPARRPNSTSTQQVAARGVEPTFRSTFSIRKWRIVLLPCCQYLFAAFSNYMSFYTWNIDFISM